MYCQICKKYNHNVETCYKNPKNAKELISKVGVVTETTAREGLQVGEEILCGAIDKE
jgi:hypothetical protein